MGATCTAAQTHMHSQRIPSQEYDQNGAESGGGDALPSEWRRCASQRPIASVAAGGSARFRLLTCGRRSQHAMSAKIGATFWPHERQAPIIRQATEGGDCEAGRLAEAKKFWGRRYVGIPAAEGRSFCTEDPAGRVVPATGEYRAAPGERGEGPRHLASAQKSQHNYPARELRAVGDGVGRAEPLAPAFQLSPSTATETKKKEGSSTPPGPECWYDASLAVQHEAH